MIGTIEDIQFLKPIEESDVTPKLQLFALKNAAKILRILADQPTYKKANLSLDFQNKAYLLESLHKDLSKHLV